MRENARPELLATVFSDYICPFCYIGDLRLERLRAHYDLRINWCMIEIHPDTPSTGRPVSELGYSQDQWTTMMDNLNRLAAEEGVTLCEHDFTTSSHQALLLAEAAKEAGHDIFYALHRRLFTAFFEDGLNIGDENILAGLATSCAVPGDIIKRAWTDRQYEDRLRLNQAVAGQYGVRATPTVFFSESARLDGALPFDAFLQQASRGLQEQQASNS
jgi:predicted DsbA family dithiol-disulfide isomerase